MAQLIVAISREFGSGGHQIATELSEKLGLPMYDRNMLDQMAEKNGLDPEDLHKHDETRHWGLTRTVRGHSTSVQEHIAQIQFDFIKAKAEAGESFVVVGRCAENILRGHRGLISIFVRGDADVKTERVSKLYNLSKAEAKIKMLRHDKKRKAYHNYYSDIKWGDSRGYDMCINSSKIGVEKSASALLSFINEYRKELEE